MFHIHCSWAFAVTELKVCIWTSACENIQFKIVFEIYCYDDMNFTFSLNQASNKKTYVWDFTIHVKLRQAMAILDKYILIPYHKKPSGIGFRVSYSKPRSNLRLNQ